MWESFVIYCCTATVSGGKVQVIPQQLAVFNVKKTPKGYRNFN